MNFRKPFFLYSFRPVIGLPAKGLPDNNTPVAALPAKVFFNENGYDKTQKRTAPGGFPGAVFWYLVDHEKTFNLLICNG
jgi:hypothetical protein